MCIRIVKIRRLRRCVFPLIRSNEQPAHEVNVQVAEHPTDICTLNVVLGDIQRDKECDEGWPSEIQVQQNQEERLNVVVKK